MATKKPAIKPALPKLKKGEIYVGITLHEDKLAHLVLLPGDEEKNHADALAWAKAQGGELPTRHDMLVLWKNARKKFQTRWYWTSEAHDKYADYAWIQYFSSGYQDSNPKSYDFRCRAVRRVAL